MDDINLCRCRSGDGYKYYGGHYRQSAIIHPPSGGDWNVVIDDAGEVTASVHAANHTPAKPLRGGAVMPHQLGRIYEAIAVRLQKYWRRSPTRGVLHGRGLSESPIADGWKG